MSAHLMPNTRGTQLATIEIHDWRAGLSKFGEPWSQTVTQTKSNPSLHPQWLDATLSAWNMTTRSSLAVVRIGVQDVAFIPFHVQRRSVAGIPVRCLELSSNVFSYHAEIAHIGDLPALLAAFLAERRLPTWDVFRVTNVAAESETASVTKALAQELHSGVSVRAGERSPYISINQDWTSFLADRPKKVRANILRSKRLMADAGETALTRFENGSDHERLLRDILDVEARSWKLGAGVAITAGTEQCAYYERLLPWLSNNGLLAEVLYVKDRPAAYTLCANWGGWVGQLKTSFIQELKDAGSRVIHSSLERAFELSATEYDFLGDAAPHKLRWTDNIRPHEDIWLFRRSFKGAALNKLKQVADRRHASKAAASPAEASE